jgi:hypothetical protein
MTAKKADGGSSEDGGPACGGVGSEAGREDSSRGSGGRRPGEPGCRRCRCGSCFEAEQESYRQAGRIILTVLVCVVLCVWNDWDIRRLARAVEQLGHRQ